MVVKRRRESAPEPERVTYCAYCKARTPHQVKDATVNREGTGGSLVCKKCGSARLGTIQGFDASLM